MVGNARPFFMFVFQVQIKIYQNNFLTYKRNKKTLQELYLKETE